MFAIVRILLIWSMPILAMLCGAFLLFKGVAWRHILYWWGKSTGVFLLRIPMILLGLPIVALALPFRIEHPETETVFRDPEQMPGTHTMVTLPAWARPWDNIFDGAEGDWRGWWNTYCWENFKRSARAFWSMFVWLAVRNPANYWSRVTTGVDVSDCSFEVLAGQRVCDEDNPGWHFILATRSDGARFYYFTAWLPWWFDSTHFAYARFGWKIDMDHAGTSPEARIQDRLKGFVFRASPWKSD